MKTYYVWCTGTLNDTIMHDDFILVDATSKEEAARKALMDYARDRDDDDGIEYHVADVFESTGYRM